MNDLIRKLAEQCTTQYQDGNGGYIDQVDTEKFAQLIVEQCVQQCESVGEMAEQTNFGEMARKTKSTANGCAQMIKWRFGVK